MRAMPTDRWNPLRAAVRICARGASDIEVPVTSEVTGTSRDETNDQHDHDTTPARADGAESPGTRPCPAGLRHRRQQLTGARVLPESKLALRLADRDAVPATLSAT